MSLGFRLGTDVFPFGFRINLALGREELFVASYAIPKWLGFSFASASGGLSAYAGIGLGIMLRLLSSPFLLRGMVP